MIERSRSLGTQRVVIVAIEPACVLGAVHFDHGRGGDDPPEPAFLDDLLPYVLEGLAKLRDEVFANAKGPSPRIGIPIH